jgi:hypothetical protein
MFERKMLSHFILTAIVLLMAGQSGVRAQTSAQAAGKEMVKDEVYTSIARRLNALAESPVTAIVAEVDAILEVTNVAMEADGKATATVKERTPSEGSTPSRPVRLKFAPPASGDQWQAKHLATPHPKPITEKTGSNSGAPQHAPPLLACRLPIAQNESPIHQNVPHTF